MTHQFDPDAHGAYVESSGLDFRQKASIVAGGLLAFVLLVFVFSNTETTQVSWLGFEGRFPLWLALLGAAVAGVLLWPLLRSVVRGARGSERRAAGGEGGGEGSTRDKR